MARKNTTEAKPEDQPGEAVPLDRYNLPPELAAQARLYALAENPEAGDAFVAARDEGFGG